MLWAAGRGFLAAVILLSPLAMRGDAQSIPVPMGDLEGGAFVMPMRSVLANTVMAAYQKPYALNFEVWRPQGMPAGWYATFDGYPVAQVAPNRWVYGRTGMDGCLVPTDVLVGSVVPMRVPHLARVTAPWICNDFIRSAAFRKILDWGCDNMGIFSDPLTSTVLAWRSGRPGVWVWLADQWKKISPSGGQYTWEAIQRRRLWIVERLREMDFFWSCADVCDLANLARSWGMIWHGAVPLRSVKGYRHGGGGDGGGMSAPAPAFSSPEAPQENPGSQWDVGNGGGTSPGGGSGGGGGGGWDTGK